MKLILNKSLILNEWRQDMIGNWFRCVSKDHLPAPSPGMVYKEEFFVEIFIPKNIINLMDYAVWFKLFWMEKLFETQFNKSDNIDVIKEKVDNFLIRASKLIIFS